MAAGSQRGQVALQAFQGREEVGDQNNEAALADDVRGTFERGGQISAATCGWLLKRMHQMAQMSGAMARGQVLAELLVESEQADRIALQVEEIREGRRQSGSIVCLGVGDRAIGH